MTTPVWPVDVPAAFLRDSYSETAAALVIRSTIEAGPRHARRVTTAADSTISGEIRMTTAQRDALVAFFLGASDAGARYFLFELPDRAAASLVRFAEPPAWVPAAAIDKWIVRVVFDAQA